MERGERIELLVDKTESLENTAIKFKTSARSLKRAMVRSVLSLVVFCGVIVVVVVVVVFSCCCCCCCFFLLLLL